MKNVEDYLLENAKYKVERNFYYDIVQKQTGCIDKCKFSYKEVVKKARYYGIYYYKCHYCGSYHLTKQPTYESIMEEEV